MKKVLSILLLIAFTFSTVGVIANSYTCNMMKMKTNECCDKTSKSCCTHEVKLLKLKDDFVSASPSKILIPTTVIAIISAQIDCIILQKNYSTDNFQSDLAPPGKVIDRLSFIQSFLI